MTGLPKRSECKCACHNNYAIIHMWRCCNPDPEPAAAHDTHEHDLGFTVADPEPYDDFVKQEEEEITGIPREIVESLTPIPEPEKRRKNK